MPKKAVDARIPTLIRNGVQQQKRSFFVIVGDRGKEQIVNLHFLLTAADLKQDKSVLWAYKHKLLDFSSHRKKREKKIRKEIKRGQRDKNTEDPFELFVSLQNIRYVYYKETEKILGQTFGMCILQDFEAITPNLLARTVETVQGGGIVVILLKTMTSLKQMYSMTMDVHSRYRTEAHNDVVARFNERFLLSLGACESCLVVDDELNVLPISGAKTVAPLPASENFHPSPELAQMKTAAEDTQPAGSLVALAQTADQAKAILSFVEVVTEKKLRSTITLTAARGRGKSAALGVAVAAAVLQGYSNIFITSPSPENLKTLFEFIFKAFDVLGYEEHLHYDIVQSSNVAFNKAVVRVNIFRNHRQTIQYIIPNDAHVLGQAELLVIDEAAAIPLPLVRKLMGSYLIFMASTINGYEGTGRSLSLKLIQQLREQSRSVKDGQESGQGTGSRTLRELSLSEPIRYAPDDSVEKWLNKLLCLDATLPPSRFSAQGCPHPSKCSLFHINRDTLFSFHPVSESFLDKLMALYVASHYKNSPNDLQLLSDAPAHHLFVLLPPIDPQDTRLPEPLCVIQVALEGEISKQTILNSLSRGQRAGGDLIPWLVSQQFQDDGFAGLSGARIVRIATNPEYLKMGYGTRALELLSNFYEGKFMNLSEDATPYAIHDTARKVTDEEIEQSKLHSDSIRIRDPKSMPPLLLKLSEVKPDPLVYLGVSFGITSPLHKFWKRCGYIPIYLRQTPNDLTGEYTCVMLKVLPGNDASWLGEFSKDFHKRFLSLLSFGFRDFSPIQALSVLEAAEHGYSKQHIPGIAKQELDLLLSPFDLKRLESYANSMLDYHVIVDMLPLIASLYFSDRLEGLKLSGVQAAILLGIGLQRKTVDDLEKELKLASNQILALFIKIVRKITTHFRVIVTKAMEETLPPNPTLHHEEHQNGVVVNGFEPLEQNLEEEVEEAGDDVDREFREKQKELINSLDLQQ